MRELPPQFSDLLFTEPTYPGSKTKRIKHEKPRPEPKPEPTWDAHPKTFLIGGKPVEFFTAGAVAKALNRKIVTIRQWELRGKIPKARFRDPAGRRIYPRAVVEGLIALAEKHGILSFDVKPDRIPPQFTEDVIALWKEPV